MKHNLSLIEIEEAVAKLFGWRQNIIVPNISWGLFIHECDLLIVRPTGYTIEIEIKRSLADMKNDFKKSHNHIDRHNRIKEMYYAIPEELQKSCEPLIPDKCGLITVKLYNNKLCAKIVKKAKPNNNAVKLTDKEIFHVAKLGTMRIWGLKQKLIEIKNKK